jgi:hypothetical protein
MKYLPHRYSIWFTRSGEQDKAISDMNKLADNQKKNDNQKTDELKSKL